jgi:hypothetical protein
MDKSVRKILEEAFQQCQKQHGVVLTRVEFSADVVQLDGERVLTDIEIEALVNSKGKSNG